MPDGYHLYFSDGFKLTVGAAAVVYDMRGWDGIAFLLNDATTTATLQMADDVGMATNLVTPVVEVDGGTAIRMNSGSSLPFWVEAWRPTKRFVRLSGVTGNAYAFQFRHTGTMPPTPAPNRAGGRVT